MPAGSYPAGQLTVRGATVDIFTDDNGLWNAYPGGRQVTAPTRDDLAKALARQLRAAATSVAVPFLAIRNGRVVQGTATGIHSSSRNILATWHDGRTEQLSAIASGDKFMGGGTDPGEWQRLIDDNRRAARALYAFEQAHKMDLRRNVNDAVNAAVAATGNDE